MITIGFVGKSGTGKSHHAMILARQLGCEAIIDDGLLIIGGKKISGSSAKKEPTKIQAVKRAVFLKEDHAAQVAASIREFTLDKLLILGTSERMIKEICRNLKLPAPRRFIPIEDVSSGEDIIKALKSRNEQGKHVIPLPVPEIAEDFKGFLLDRMRIFFRSGNKQHSAEKSIVRPAFSQMGKLDIDRQVFGDLLQHLVSQFPGITQLQKFSYDPADSSIRVFLGIDLEKLAQTELRAELERFQEEALQSFHRYATTEIESVHLQVNRRRKVIAK